MTTEAEVPQSMDVTKAITTLQNARAAKAARMTEIMQQALDDGRSSDEAEQEEFDTFLSEVKAIDEDLKRLRALAEMNGIQAKPNGQDKAEADSAAPRPRAGVQVIEPQLEPGIRFARMVKCLGVAKGNRAEAHRAAEVRYGDDKVLVATLKAAAMLGETSDLITKVPMAGSDWGALAALVCSEGMVFGDFLEYLRPQTLVGRASQVIKIPFRTAVVSHEGTERITLPPRKLTALVTVTEDLLRDSSPSADAYVRDQMVQGVGKKLDEAFREEIGDEATPIYLADEGGLAVELAFHLTPHHFEHDLVVLKVQRTINWAKR
jgi:hypothetical protein